MLLVLCINEDYLCCVKSVQFRVKFVAGHITLLVINNVNRANMSNYFSTTTYWGSNSIHFLLAMCLHGSLICYVCYVLNMDYRCCVKRIQFRVKLVAGYITILVMNNENLLACQIIWL